MWDCCSTLQPLIGNHLEHFVNLGHWPLAIRNIWEYHTCDDGMMMGLTLWGNFWSHSSYSDTPVPLHGFYF